MSLDTFAGKIQLRWAPEAGVSSFGQMPFFIEFFEDEWLVRRLGEGLPAAIYESERAAEAGCVGDDSVIGAGGTLAVRAHQRAARRRRESGVIGHYEGSQ